MMFAWPVPGPITRGFDYLSSIYVGGQHAAIDIAAPTGTPIRAVAAGNVVGVGWDFYSGFFVAIDHAHGWRSWYRHLYGQTPVVVGQSVTQGQVIGNVGNTGYSLGPHLHFDLWNAVRQDATAFAKHDIWAHDPELYLGQEDDDVNLQEIEAAINELRQAVYGEHAPDDRISIVDRKIDALRRDHDVLRNDAGAGDQGLAEALALLRRDADAGDQGLKAAIEVLRQQIAAGGVSEAQVKALIEGAGHTVD